MDMVNEVPEQRRIYQKGVPPNRENGMMISGPPGTGKTVIALYRAQKILIEKADAQVRFIMFNHTLEKYCKNCVETVRSQVQKQTERNIGERFIVSSYHSWLYGWMQRCSRAGVCPNKKLWEPQPYNYNFDRIYEDIYDCVARGKKKQIPGWGYLIVDEGQDFKPGLYDLIGLMKNENLLVEFLVMGDENQQLNVKDNSTLQEMSEGVFGDYVQPDEERHHLLKTNFRNSVQIAKATEKCFTGLDTGKPDLPPATNQGDVPKYHECHSESSAEDKLIEITKGIALVANQKTIGVVVEGVENGQLDRVFESLKGFLGENRVSYYHRLDNWEANNRLLEKLEFDKAGSVVVLTDQSVKGLEFDVVVCSRFGKVEEDGYKKNSYVVFSRAREELHIVCVHNSDFKSLLGDTVERVQ